MRKILISICLSLLAFNAYSQSKLVGAGKGTKVGGSAASKTVSTKTPVKKATPTKPFSQKSSVKQDANERYASSAYMEITGVSFGNVDNGLILTNIINHLFNCINYICNFIRFNKFLIFQ